MIRILEGDCREVMATLPEHSVDSIVTDPPAGIGFMGKEWDHDKGGRDSWIAWMTLVATEALRVLKPGGHALVWAIPRTSHWTAMAWENAGFVVRDRVSHLFGSGFPKSLDVSKAIDKAQGNTGTFGAPKSAAHAGWIDRGRMRGEDGNEGYQRPWMADEEAVDRNARQYVGGSDESRQWQGWGTALKPAMEDWWLLRKPLAAGTVAANVLRFGTGALNIDASRVLSSEPNPSIARRQGAINHLSDRPAAETEAEGRIASRQSPEAFRAERAGESLGRWPANVCHDGSDEVLAAFPQSQDGVAVQRNRDGGVHNEVFGAYRKPVGEDMGYGGGGSAARFFKECKWDRPESTAAIAASTSSLSSALAASVASAAAIWPSLAGVLDAGCSDRSMNVTGSELGTLCEVATAAMASIGSGFSRESQLEKRTPCGGLAKVAAMLRPIGTTTITASLLRFDGSAVAVTFYITHTRLDRGEQGSVSRLYYTAKASRHDRNDGLQRVSGSERSGHPTVKPTDLMRYLCRLVTPPGGTVLDPFCGSGSTLKAAELEGFSAIGIELDPAYIEIAKRRIASDMPLFAEVAA